LLGKEAIDDAAHVLAEVRADGAYLAVDARLDLAGEEAVTVDFRRAASLPRHPVANEIERASCGIGLGIESHLAQEHEHVHRGIPAPIPRGARPASVGTLEGEQVRAGALGCDPRALEREFRRGRIRSSRASPASGSTDRNRAASEPRRSATTRSGRLQCARSSRLSYRARCVYELAPPTRAGPLPPHRPAESRHVPAATFCTICSGLVAPAITLATVGCARSHANARSSSVRPRDFANDSSCATTASSHRR
jgi:hypothetical protein